MAEHSDIAVGERRLKENIKASLKANSLNRRLSLGKTELSFEVLSDKRAVTFATRT